MGKKPPKIAPSPWDCITPPEENRATARGNMHKKIGKDRPYWFDAMFADTQTRSLQYFATARMGEVINTKS